MIRQYTATTPRASPLAVRDYVPAIRMRGFVKRFGLIAAVAGFDLDVPAGTCVGLLGPNGAGKSTTMKALTAEVIPDEGELEVPASTLKPPQYPDMGQNATSGLPQAS